MKITFIQTGGTIDKDYPRATKGYAFEISEPSVKRILKVLNPNFDFEIIPLLQKDSLDLTDAERHLILSTCRNSDSTRIIITHGTDTMMETAQVLSVIVNKTIILTGATKPELFKDSDAHINVGASIGAIQNLDYGVYIVMHGRVFPWDGITRNPTTGRFMEK